MKVLGASVYWALKWANNPQLILWVDRIPKTKELRFWRTGSIYYAEKGGYVEFNAWRGPGNERGLGGAQVPITLKNGHMVTWLGPWSSRAGYVNRHCGHRIQCVDVMLTEHEDTFRRAGCCSAGAVTLELAREAARIAGCHLVRVEDASDGDITYVPSICEGAVVKPGEDTDNGYACPVCGETYSSKDLAIGCCEPMDERDQT